jgi:outer membrane lipase/esterase
MFYILLCFIIILINNLLSNSHKFPFDTIISFGDDNTDTGNTYNLTDDQWPLVPPYYNGRFTNGPVWIEMLGMTTIMNYAYIGATIDNNNLVMGFTGPNRTNVPGIRQQIQTYLSNIDVTATNSSRTLYVIWGGTNDYLDDPSLTADLVVSSLMDAVYDLVLVEIANLLVINQPPLQAYPPFNRPTENKTISALIINHNTYLSSNISQVATEYTQTSIQIFDLYSLITNILSNNSIPTLNTIDACWDILNDSRVLLQCKNPNNYVFIDNYHFTTSIHQTIAGNIRQFLLKSSSYPISFSKLLCFMYIILFMIKKN